MVQINIDTAEIRRLAEGLRNAGKKADPLYRRALARAGDTTRTAMVRSLTSQTGLKRKVIVKALKREVSYGSLKSGMNYSIKARGGDISLKYFSPREAKGGVTAKPFGKRTTVSMAFLKGGRKPNRVPLNVGGHVFRRTSASRTPIELVDSGVVIPQEMVTGATEAAFHSTIEKELPKRLLHEFGQALPK